VSARADYLNMFSVYFNEPNLINTEIEKYKAIGTADIKRMAAAYLQNDNRAVLTYLPGDKEKK